MKNYNYTLLSNKIENFSDDFRISQRVGTNSTNTHKLTLDVQVQFSHNSQNNEILDLLFQSFINQRKAHRYYVAETEYENDIITEKEFEKIEKSCTITISKKNTKHLKEKLVFMYDNIQKRYPEELEYMSNDDLSELFGVSKLAIQKLLK